MRTHSTSEWLSPSANAVHATSDAVLLPSTYTHSEHSEHHSGALRSRRLAVHQIVGIPSSSNRDFVCNRRAQPFTSYLLSLSLTDIFIQPKLVCVFDSRGRVETKHSCSSVRKIDYYICTPASNLLLNIFRVHSSPWDDTHTHTQHL